MLQVTFKLFGFQYWSAYKFRVETKTASIMNFYDRPGCDYGIEPILIPLEERIINMIWNKDVMDYVPDFVSFFGINFLISLICVI